MANIEHQEQLDTIDKISVLAYRAGWLFLVYSFLWAGYSIAVQGSVWQPLWLLAVACSLLAQNLHIYSKAIRYWVQACAWVALLLSLSFYLWHWPLIAMLALGAFYVVIAALAFKESFCFNLGLLRWLPLILLVDWLLHVSPWSALRIVSLGLIALACIYIAVKKCRQPLHYDIGKRDNYQL